LPVEKSGEAAKAEVCRILNRIGALEFGAFKLTSGKISPYYVDLRIVPSFPDAFRKVSDLYVSFVGGDVGSGNFERIAGIPVAGIPFASLVAYAMRKPFFFIRKGVRLRGRQRRIEGVIAPGDRVLLIDDLVTTGLSLQKAAKTITAEGGVVADAAVLIDRQEGGRERLQKSGIRLHAMLEMGEIAERLCELGGIDDEQLKTILKQIKKK